MNIPDGYRLVPVEPTDQMLGDAMDAYSEMDGKRHRFSNTLRPVYSAMLAAAPVPPQPIYDEAKERELFKAVYFRCDLSEDWLSGAFKDKQTRDMWDGWRECAQSRAKAGEDK